VVGGSWLVVIANRQPPTTNDQTGPGIFPAADHFMRFLKIYLIGYFILLLGAGLALWQSGILRQIPGVWLAIGAIIAIGLGIMLAVASGRPAITTRE
jgi:hypothetical protein